MDEQWSQSTLGPLINIITLPEVMHTPGEDVSHYLLKRALTDYEERAQSGV